MNDDDEFTPWYVRVFEGTAPPLALAAGLVMSAPGEYELAILAGWSPKMAWLMPFLLSVYAAVVVVRASKFSAGSLRWWSAKLGAVLAFGLGLSAQIAAHRLAAGYMVTSDALVSAISSIPLVAVTHILHLTVSAPSRKATGGKPVSGRSRGVRSSWLRWQRGGRGRRGVSSTTAMGAEAMAQMSAPMTGANGHVGAPVPDVAALSGGSGQAAGNFGHVASQVAAPMTGVSGDGQGVPGHVAGATGRVTAPVPGVAGGGQAVASHATDMTGHLSAGIQEMSDQMPANFGHSASMPGHLPAGVASQIAGNFGHSGPTTGHLPAGVSGDGQGVPGHVAGATGHVGAPVPDVAALSGGSGQAAGNFGHVASQVPDMASHVSGRMSGRVVPDDVRAMHMTGATGHVAGATGRVDAPVTGVSTGMSGVSSHVVESCPDTAKNSGHSGSRGVNLEKIAAVVASLKASDEPVTGEALGKAFGKNPRTGRRYLKKIEEAEAVA